MLLYKREEGDYTDEKKEGNMKIEADNTVRWPQAMECQQLQEAGRGRKQFYPRVPETAWSCQHLDFRPEILIWGFWPPKL